jgi:hypothetical protein
LRFSYVYHVHAKNYTGFLEAIESAINTPFDRYMNFNHYTLAMLIFIVCRFIPDHMTERGVKERLINLMETDWRAKAEETLKQNMKKIERGEEAYVSLTRY